jgi:CRP-like cAMP-binding protein
MTLEDDIGILAGVEIFEDFTPEQLRLLAFGTERLKLGIGREIYGEGDTADSAYIVVSGTVALVRDTEAGRVVVAQCGRGTVLGELALIVESKRLTGAVAAGDVEVVKLNRHLFRRMLEEYPHVAVMLHRRFSRNLTTMIAKIESLAPKFQ